MTQTQSDVITAGPDGSIFLPQPWLSDREVAALDLALLTGRYPGIREALAYDELAAVDEARLLKLRIKLGRRSTT